MRKITINGKEITVNAFKTKKAVKASGVHPIKSKARNTKLTVKARVKRKKD